MTTTATAAHGAASPPTPELARNLDAIVERADHLDHRDCAIALIADTGIATREAVGLSWGDVDLDAAQAALAREYDDTRTLRDLPVARKRSVHLSPTLVVKLRAFAARQRACFRRYVPNLVTRAGDPAIAAWAPLFANEEGVRALPRTISRRWNAVRAGFGFEGWTLAQIRRARLSLPAPKERR